MRWWPLRRVPRLRRGRGGEVWPPANPLVGLVDEVWIDEHGIGMRGTQVGTDQPISTLRAGTDVGIVHNVSFDRATIVAGQSGIRPDSYVWLKDNRCLNWTGVVLHVDDDGAVVRWPFHYEGSGMVTIERHEALEVVKW